MTAERQPALDSDVIEGLRSLETEDTPGLFAELVELFLSDTPPRLGELAEAMAARDASRIEAVAHSLKSSCGNLGALGLADLFRQIETLGRDASLEDVPSLVAESDQEFQRVEDALRSELG